MVAITVVGDVTLHKKTEGCKGGFIFEGTLTSHVLRWAYATFEEGGDFTLLSLHFCLIIF